MLACVVCLCDGDTTQQRLYIQRHFTATNTVCVLSHTRPSSRCTTANTQLNGGGGGPAYDRGTGELLAPAVVDATLLLPGGAAAAKRRQLAQQASAPADGIDGGGGVFEGGGGGGAGDTPGPKRQRVGMNKCHNCGSYQHVLSNCPAPFDQVCGVFRVVCGGGGAGR